jgi:hypothetical protein
LAAAFTMAEKRFQLKTQRFEAPRRSKMAELILDVFLYSLPCPY